MLVKVLGTASSGGFPQWNCNCRYCAQTRVKHDGKNGGAQGGEQPALTHRMHSSLALSASERSWYLVNASPDIRFQIESFEALHPGPDVRETPIQGVLLTDARIDHIVGLLIIREGARMQVFATEPVLATISKQFPLVTILSAHATFEWTTINCDKPFFIDSGNIKVESIAMSGQAPRYVAAFRHPPRAPDWVVAYKFTDTLEGGCVVVAPQIAHMDDAVLDVFEDADCLFLDGSFFYDDDLKRVGISGKSAKELGHLPLQKDDGIVAGVKKLNSRRAASGKLPVRVILLNVNNTNPILMDGSDERSIIRDAGIEIGTDGELVIV